MALRASISLSSLQASVSSELVTTQTMYQLGNATSIWLNPDSKNRAFSGNFSMDDLAFTVLAKQVADDYLYMDSSTGLALGKSVGKVINRVLDISGLSGVSQSHSRLATLQNGNTVAVWLHTNTIGTPSIMATVYTSYSVNEVATTEMISSSSTSVNTTVVGLDVAALSGGGFVITYVGIAPTEIDDGDTYVLARTYTEDMVYIDTITVASSPDILIRPVVCGLPNDSFAVAWTHFNSSSTDVHARVLGVGANKYDYNSFIVNEDYLPVDQANPSITGLVGGGFAVLFNGATSSGAVFDLVSTLYDNDGTRLFGPISFDGSTSPYAAHYSSFASRRLTDIAALQNGGFVLIVHALSNYYSLYFQLHNSSGTQLGPKVIIAEDSGSKGDVCVVGLLDGGFAVAWENTTSDVDVYRIETQRFSSTGSPVTPVLLASSGLNTTQEHPSITYSGYDYIVSWDTPIADSLPVDGYTSVVLRGINELTPLALDAYEAVYTITDARIDWYDPAGTLVTDPTGGNTQGGVSLSGVIVLPTSMEGPCTVSLSSPDTMFGYNITIHTVVATISNGIISITFLYDWNTSIDIPVVLEVNASLNCNGNVLSFVTTDPDGDGIIGSPMVSGPFIGFSIGISGEASSEAVLVGEEEIMYLADTIEIEVFSGA